MLELIFGIIIVIGIFYTLQMMLSTDMQLNKLPPVISPDQFHPVTILKPLKGVDDNLEDNLKSFFKLDYPEYEILFGINSKDDPAVKIVKRLIKKYSHIKSKLVISAHGDFLNPKINNLNNIVFHSQYDYLLISDSNVKVEPHYLKENMKLMTLPNAGLVTSTIKGTGAQNLGSILENLHLNTFVAGSVFFVSKILRYPIVIGKSMLLKREVLEKINGFKAFANVLAEDHLIGKEVRKAGYNIYHSSFVINNINIQWSMKRFFNRHIRWAMMRRKLNIFHYMAELLANPIMMAFGYLIATFNYESLIIFNLISFIKIIFDFQIGTAVGADLKWYQYLLIPAKDILIGFVWFIPFVYNKIDWRGNSFLISRGTQLKPA
jgi:ceramide glucosyltransferase